MNGPPAVESGVCNKKRDIILNVVGYASFVLSVVFYELGTSTTSQVVALVMLIVFVGTAFGDAWDDTKDMVEFWIPSSRDAIIVDQDSSGTP